MTWKMDGTGCFNLKHECAVCGSVFEYVCPADYYKDAWHNHFECCSFDCLERCFDYDKFKASGIKNTEQNWRIWVEEKAMIDIRQYLTPEAIWKRHCETAKSIGIEKWLLESGLDLEFASSMAWGDLENTQFFEKGFIIEK